MIQEILEYYFDKKVSDLLSKFVTRDEFKTSLSIKLDNKTFREYEKMIASDRTQELKNFQYEEKLFNLERTFLKYVTKEDQASALREKVSHQMLDELKDQVEKMRTIHVSMEETITQKVSVLKDDFESKTKEMMDQIEDLNKKMEEIEEEEGSYDDEESDQDLDSELGDTLDVNAMDRDKILFNKDNDGDTTPTNEKNSSKQGGAAETKGPQSESADEDDRDASASQPSKGR